MSAVVAITRSQDDRRPLHEWLADTIRADILSGRLKPGDVLPPEHELCRQYNSSRTPVRQAMMSLVQQGLVERTRGKGSIITEMGYVNGAAARSHSSDRSSQTKLQIAVLVGELSRNLITSRLTEGLDRAAAEYGLNCDISYLHHTVDSADDAVARNFLEPDGYDAKIVIPRHQASYDWLEKVASPPVPLIALYARLKNPHLHTYYVQHDVGTCRATDYLLRLGHKRIGMLLTYHMWGAVQHTTAARQAGYERALMEAGITPDRNLVQNCVTVDRADVIQATRTLLTSPRRPTAILVGGVKLLVPAMEAIEELQLKVPDDLSVVICDDVPYAREYDPPLSTVDLPLGLCARNALLGAARAARSPDLPPVHLGIEPDLIIRGSCKPVVDNDAK